jgi:cytoskeletal protein CcmA (bactofilin family)
MFSKKGRKPAAIHTLIGSNTQIEGDLHFEGGCHIDGLLNGSVVGDSNSDAYLSMSESGRVQGNVTVPTLAISGTVDGDVYVSERVVLNSTARVNGNVHYNLIEMAAGAEIKGQHIHEGAPASAPVKSESAAASEDLGEWQRASQSN